jgi:excisionase family DNA binding protein
MTNNEPVLYSAEQVAERLGLHVRTVRNYVRDGRLRAVRIGKQYRISQQDLDALTAAPAAPVTPSVPTASAEVTSVVQIDAIDTHLADRLSTHLIAGAQMTSRTPDGVRIQTVHDRERHRLKIVILGGATVTADILQIIDAFLGVTDPDGAPDV